MERNTSSSTVAEGRVRGSSHLRRAFLGAQRVGLPVLDPLLDLAAGFHFAIRHRAAQIRNLGIVYVR